MKKYVWIYPKSNIWNLERCHIFYGNEKEYKEFMKGTRGRSMDQIMEQTIKFAKTS